MSLVVCDQCAHTGHGALSNHGTATFETAKGAFFLWVQVALVGWRPDAVKPTSRDGWIGWSAEQQMRHLQQIADNSRFVILTRCRVPDLASRVPALQGHYTVRGPGEMN